MCGCELWSPSELIMIAILEELQGTMHTLKEQTGREIGWGQVR